MRFPWASLVFASGVGPVLYWIVQGRGGRMPPGPLGLPIWGYIPFLSSEPHKDFSKLAEYYGPIFSVPLRRRYAIILNDISSIKKILYQKKEAMKKRNCKRIDIKHAKKILKQLRERTGFRRPVYLTDWKDLLRKIAYNLEENYTHQNAINVFYALTAFPWKKYTPIKRRRIMFYVSRSLLHMKRDSRFVIDWMMITSLAYPSIQQTLTTEEIQNDVELDPFPVSKDLARMPDFRSVILEFFRWKAPLIFLWVPEKDIILNDYFIPKDSLIIANIWFINHSSFYLGEDYNEFKPESFSKHDGKRIREMDFITLLKVQYELNPCDNIIG